MGWTSYNSTMFKGLKVDRKAECDAYILRGGNEDRYKILKSSMVGSTYFSAIQDLKTKIVFCVVILTSCKNQQIYFKEMEESEHPYYYNCPKSILNLLSPTDSELAKEWRKKCLEYHKNKNSKNSISNLPVGSVIEFIWNGRNISLIKCPPAYQFKTNWWKYIDKNNYFKKNWIPKEYKITRYGAEEK